MPIGERGCRGSGALQVREDEVETAPRDQHHRRIQDVLAGGAVVHVRGGIPGDRGAQGIDQGNHRIGTADGSPPELRNVERVNAALTGNAVGRRLRDDADPCLRPRQRRFDVEHRLHPGAVGHGGQHYIGAEAWPEERVRWQRRRSPVRPAA